MGGPQKPWAITPPESRPDDVSEARSDDVTVFLGVDLLSPKRIFLKSLVILLRKASASSDEDILWGSSGPEIIEIQNVAQLLSWR